MSNMAALQLQLPDDLKARLQARATECGYESVEQYVQDILRASAEEEVVDEDVEAVLIQRLDDPQGEIEFTPQFQQQFREQVKQRRDSRKS
jgi:plasmid stability protein